MGFERALSSNIVLTTQASAYTSTSINNEHQELMRQQVQCLLMVVLVLLTYSNFLTKLIFKQRVVHRPFFYLKNVFDCKKMKIGCICGRFFKSSFYKNALRNQ